MPKARHHHIMMLSYTWQGLWVFHCDCGRSKGEYGTALSASRAGFKHVRWHMMKMQDDLWKEVMQMLSRSEPDLEPDDDSIERQRRVGRPAMLTPDKVIPPVRLAQPPNPARKVAPDLEDTDEL